jgi:hypothetical protein
MGVLEVDSREVVAFALYTRASASTGFDVPFRSALIRLIDDDLPTRERAHEAGLARRKTGGSEP